MVENTNQLLYLNHLNYWVNFMKHGEWLKNPFILLSIASITSLIHYTIFVYYICSCMPEMPQNTYFYISLLTPSLWQL